MSNLFEIIYLEKMKKDIKIEIIKYTISVIFVIFFIFVSWCVGYLVMPTTVPFVFDRILAGVVLNVAFITIVIIIKKFIDDI